MSQCLPNKLNGLGSRSLNAKQDPQNGVLVERPAFGIGDSEKNFGRAAAKNWRTERQASGLLVFK